MAVFYKYEYRNKRKNIHPWLNYLRILPSGQHQCLIAPSSKNLSSQLNQSRRKLLNRTPAQQLERPLLSRQSFLASAPTTLIRLNQGNLQALQGQRGWSSLQPPLKAHSATTQVLQGKWPNQVKKAREKLALHCILQLSFHQEEAKWLVLIKESPSM